MYKGRIIIQVINDKGEIAQELMDCSAPSLEMLQGMTKDILFTRSGGLCDHLFAEPDFKPLKKELPKPTPKPVAPAKPGKKEAPKNAKTKNA